MTNLLENQPTSALGKRQFPWLIAVISSIFLIGLLVVLGMWMKQSKVTSLEIGAAVPDFTVTSFDGETYTKSALEGKLILVNFWSSWCSSCDEEGYALEEVWQEVKSSGDIVFIGVNYVDTEKDSIAFINKYSLTYPNGPDPLPGSGPRARTVGWLVRAGSAAAV